MHFLVASPQLNLSTGSRLTVWRHLVAREAPADRRVAFSSRPPGIFGAYQARSFAIRYCALHGVCSAPLLADRSGECVQWLMRPQVEGRLS